MVSERKSGHTCEVCRTLGEVLRRLGIEKYRSGPVLEIGLAIEQALDSHTARESAWPKVRSRAVDRQSR